MDSNQLAETLRQQGSLLSEWARAVSSVPRHLFLPEVIEVGDEILSRVTDPVRWLAAAHEDVSITTQWNDGRPTGPEEYRLPTSSSSKPSLMLEMLGLLDVKPHDRVLELGAGTGLNASWMAHRLGADNVVSVEVDQGLADQAAKNAAAAGLFPRIVHGDGALGWPDGAPYDRVIATYAVADIPYAWVEQAPAGRIVAPWGGSFFPYSFAVLDVFEGRAEGHFTGYPAFMRTRHNRPPRGYLSDFLHHREDAAETATGLSPLAIAHDADALFFVGLALPDAWHLPVNADDDSGEVTVWILADDRLSWASVDYTPGRNLHTVKQYGPRHLWDEAETSYRGWEKLGRPERDRAGLSVTRAGQQIWVDSPGNVITSGSLAEQT
ncbi:methyltransferase domain-containing protein [Streptomyces sp. NPDC001553]|uniref:methyltransferase domain-containing protein n=1 Tax=Streptomyces sp. NPDC001553 TaxID=3154385 RepID=UPI00331D1C87